jgi:DNA-binding transcriptional ArsR family regulator
MKETQITAIFNALSQTTRLKVFRLLVDNSKEGMCPCNIAEKLKIPRNTLSFHLALLTKVGLCEYKKVGKTLIYKPKCEVIKQISCYLLQNCCLK